MILFCKVLVTIRQGLSPGASALIPAQLGHPLPGWLGCVPSVEGGQEAEMPKLLAEKVQ